MKTWIFFVVSAFLLGCTQVITQVVDEDAHGEALKQSLVEKHCTKTSTDYEVNVLGYLEERDDIPPREGVQKQWYGFIICRIKDLTKSSNNVEVKIASNWLTGTTFTSEKALQLAAKSQKEGKEYIMWGEPYKPVGDLDPKRVEYRLYQENGQPTAVEVYVVMRNAERTAKEPKTLRIAWT